MYGDQAAAAAAAPGKFVEKRPGLKRISARLSPRSFFRVRASRLTLAVFRRGRKRKMFFVSRSPSCFALACVAPRRFCSRARAHEDSIYCRIKGWREPEIKCFIQKYTYIFARYSFFLFSFTAKALVFRRAKFYNNASVSLLLLIASGNCNRLWSKSS